MLALENCQDHCQLLGLGFLPLGRYWWASSEWRELRTSALWRRQWVGGSDLRAGADSDEHGVWVSSVWVSHEILPCQRRAHGDPHWNTLVPKKERGSEAEARAINLNSSVPTFRKVPRRQSIIITTNSYPSSVNQRQEQEALFFIANRDRDRDHIISVSGMNFSSIWLEEGTGTGTYVNWESGELKLANIFIWHSNSDRK